ncbi:MAG: DUF3466 family protein [Verrucomicrobiales bacterium]|nr:DUF3466 family protein [Verrucomicrobiales bacterium]
MNLFAPTPMLPMHYGDSPMLRARRSLRRLVLPFLMLLGLGARAQLYDVPGSATSAEDTPSSFTFKVDNWGIYRNATVTSANAALVPSSGITVTLVSSFYIFPTQRTEWRVTYTPVANATGTVTFNINANDGAAVQSSRAVPVTITQVDDAPVITALPTAASILEDLSYAVDFRVSDLEDIAGTTVTASSSNPALVLNGSTQLSVVRTSTTGTTNTFRLTVVPALNATGVTDISVVASQGGKSVTSVLRLTVDPINDPPVLTVANQSMIEDQPFSAIVSFTDVDSPASGITVTATSSNQGLVRDADIIPSGTSNSRTLAITHTPHLYGTTTLTVTVRDPSGASDTRSFVLTVTAANDLPIAGMPTVLSLDGADDQAYASGIGMPTGNAPHTIEAWVYPNVRPASRQWILQLGSAGSGHHWLLRNDGTLQIGAWGRDAQVADVPLAIGQWSHLAAVWDGAQFAVFVNGIKVGQIPSLTGFDMATPEIWIGAVPGGGEASFNGMLDEVRIWNRALSDVEIQSRMNVPLRGDESGLLVHYPFDERQGLTAYDDAALGGRSHATLRNGAGYANRHESAGLVFDGVDDRTSVPHNVAFNAYPMTVAAWLRTTDTDGAIASKYADGSLNGWTFRVVGGRLKAWYFRDGPNNVWDGGVGFDGGEINDGRWHFVAFSVDASGGRIFVDGAQTGVRGWNGTAGATTTTQPLQFGCYGNGFNLPANQLAAGLDDLSYWNRALTLAEIQSLEQGVPVVVPNLVAFYSFAEGIGSTVVDFAAVEGGNNAGTLIGGVARGPSSAASTLGTFVVNEEAASPIFLPGFDIENMLSQPGGTPVSYSIVTLPANGTLRRGAVVLAAGSTAAWSDPTQNPLIYTPTNAYNGPDRFSYKIIDGSGGESYTVTVPILVQELNDLPTVTPISNRVIEEDGSTGEISFTIDDEETSASSLIVSAISSDTRLVPASQIVFGGSGAVRNIQVTPALGEIGTATITLIVTDSSVPAGTATLSFKVRVDPKPAYALVDLGDLGLLNQSFGNDVNDNGWSVGGAQSQPTDGHALLNRGLTGTGAAEDLDPTRLATAFGINGTNMVTGFFRQTPGAQRDAFVWQNGLLTGLGARITGSDSVGYDINNGGDVVGSFRLGTGFRRAFFLPPIGAMIDLGVLTGFAANSEALGVDRLGRVVGYSEAPDGRSRAFLWNGATLVNLGTLTGLVPAHDDSRATAINDGGLIVGYSSPNKAETSPRRAFVYESGAMRNLGLLPDGSLSEAWDINNFGQVVGKADRATKSRAFLHTAGLMRDLNDLIHDTRIVEAGQVTDFEFSASGWELQEARAINTSGAIVGAGTKAGKRRAFLAVPAWVIGKQIARPEGAVERFPEIELLGEVDGDTPQNSFHWSAYERKLYALRPVAARIKWFTSNQNTTGTGTNIQVNTDRIVVEGISVWPKDPVIHIAGAPVEIEPKDVALDHSFSGIAYQTAGGNGVVDPTSKTFTAGNPAYSVVQYYETRGSQLNPANQRPYFEVVRTMPWDHPSLLLNRNATVGEVLSDPPAAGKPGHQDYHGKTGFVFFENAFYDGLGLNRAYDRATRLGAIVPVNLDTVATHDDLVVVWYRISRIGVAWASVPVRYTVNWPGEEVVDKIVIASGKGSGPLPDTYVSPHAYSQPLRGFAGFNPNEEHAFVAPANKGDGNAFFALRNDLNDRVTPPVSEPYALLKYRDVAASQWRHRVYKVVAEDATNWFQFTGTAGTEIKPPYPLNLLTTCAESKGSAGAWWEDWKGTLYSRAAGTFGEPGEIRVRWSYPLQPDFFYDLELNGKPARQPGECVAWLDRREAGSLTGPNAGEGVQGTSIEVTYTIEWPKTPVLQIGETLLDEKNEMPSIRKMASVKVIYDDLSPGWNPLDPSGKPPLNTLARLYDPLSVRTLVLAPSNSIPDSIKRTARGGKEYFDDLPPTLESRLTYDPVNRWLQFAGVLESVSGAEPLLLPNVLSSRERDALLKLAPGVAAWSQVVDRLYDLTRNPNGVDLTPVDNLADSYRDAVIPRTNDYPGLRLGLTTVNGAVVPESLGSQPKALTAAIGGVPAPTNRPVNALSFDGTDDALDAGSVALAGRSFTLEFWAKRAVAAGKDYIAGMGTSEPSGQLIVGFDATGRFVFRFSEANEDYGVFTPSSVSDTNWNHWAVTFDAATRRQTIYRNGVQAAQETSLGGFTGGGSLLFGRRAAASPVGENEFFQGTLDEIRVWDVARSATAIARDRVKSLTGHEGGLVRYYRADRTEGGKHVDDSPSHVGGQPLGGLVSTPSDAPAAIPPRYIVLAENDSSALPGLGVQLHIIRVDDGPFEGDLKLIYPGNVFDQRLTLRHSSEFGGDPNSVQFEWFYKPDAAGFDPTALPIVAADGTITDARGWLRYSAFSPVSGQGVNDITLGEGGESGLLTLGDNWFICRLRGFNVRGAVPWSGWVGDPSGGGTPRAQLAEGWIKRVVRGLNQFDARTAEFHASESATYASMILQAGERYEGDIAFNPSAENLNSVGLIEAYTTVLNRGRKLSIEGTPPVNFNPANNALLLAAARIADLYMLLGNEAYADAQDPTIGFSTTEAPYNALASSIFAFQNQLDSLLDEELTLLRGRDESQAGVAARPIYNRLFWNFTLGEGEVAYQQNYNLSDQNLDGFIDEKDAGILYPQGHGDAWGHYLTAIKSYYGLLRHPQFTWIPRTESVTVAGVPVEVDYLDERRFARAASARAKAGSEIIDLTYRANYVDDPDGQWQGYKDTDADRAWGVAEWGWRAGQGAYFDWLTANAILPATDANPAHTGIQRIDRTTVAELDEIIAQYNEIQTVIDKADIGLNPLGLVKGAMVFDLDPTFLAVGSTAAIGRQAVQGLAHFEQLNERAIKALKNAARIWDEANARSRSLRMNQDSVDAFTLNTRDQERNFRNRLIEIYGYPYAGDIGPGKTYPSGYTGPDLYHYMYVPVSEITGQTVPPSTNFTGFFKQVDVGLLGSSYFPSEEKAYFTNYTIAATDPTTIQVDYPQSEGPWAFQAPASWGSRRAPGKIQEAVSDVLQATARLKFAGQNYDGLMADIGDRLTLLKARFNVNSNQIGVLNKQLGVTIGMNAVMGTLNGVETGLRRAANITRDIRDGAIEGIPKVVGLATDVLAPARLIVHGVSVSLNTTFDVAADGLAVAQNALNLSKETIPLTTQIELTLADQRYEVLQQVKELEALVRNEINIRLEVFEQEEVLRQSYGRYLAAIAEGQRVMDELVVFRKTAAAQTTEYRYQDMAFRIFRNEALQKYRATFDLAARYVYLCATAYDFESNFLGSDRRSASRFFDQIIRQRQLGVLIDGEPIPGDSGLADIQGRMIQNWEILEPQFGLNNPQLENGRFSLRSELFRLRDADPDRLDDLSDVNWRAVLQQNVVEDVWSIPEFRRYCRPFAPESAGKQPALVLRFPTTVQFGQNYFGKPLSGGDSAFDPSFFSTKVNAVGVRFAGYDDAGLSRTPRVYLVPVGMDVLRAPTGSSLETREWRVLDQAVPVPFAIGANDATNPNWIPGMDSLSENYGQPRRFAALRAFSETSGIDEGEMTASTRLVARSVWNTEWMLIIPGGTLLADPDAGLDRFIHSVGDIKLQMMVYSFSGQ